MKHHAGELNTTYLPVLLVELGSICNSFITLNSLSGLINFVASLNDELFWII